ncbi:hypothetical protein [Fischerella sp. PCC 9605]|uniref:hypothetical protein n=1 Tax=Fischerella sp. PCC 9605 TaxID=1173024 RepID=UPI00047AD365|nr:hypothetical protein [Fischerella sp. PCC 9605]
MLKDLVLRVPYLKQPEFLACVDVETRGFAKTKLQHIITAAAMNLVRIWQWWTEANNFGKCISRFAALAV